MFINGTIILKKNTLQYTFRYENLKKIEKFLVFNI
jgi:hypothetical protein